MSFENQEANEERFEARVAAIRAKFEIAEPELYADNAATTKTDERVLQAMDAYMEPAVNPASVHSAGLEGAGALEEARAKVAESVGAKTDRIYFTSGGTESNNWALKGCVLSGHTKAVAIGAAEHPSVSEAAEWMYRALGVKMLKVLVDSNGVVLPDIVVDTIEGEGVGLVSVQYANGETGVLNPVEDIVKACRDRDVLVHVDAVQALGKVPLRLDRLGADLVSLSAHKAHGPVGIGALYVKKGTPLDPLVHGGGQEGGMRSGTVAVHLAAGFGKAAELARLAVRKDMPRVRAMRDELERMMADRFGATVAGAGAERLPTTSKFLMDEGLECDLLCAVMDMAGVRVSSGTACAAGRGGPSLALMAMGLGEAKASASFRVSLSRMNVAGDPLRIVNAAERAIVEAKGIGV